MSLVEQRGLRFAQPCQCTCFCVSRSTPGEESPGRMVGDGKAYGQFADNVKLIYELN